MDENLTLLTRVNAKEILAAFKIDRLVTLSAVTAGDSRRSA
jgi:hypothetical protein